MTAVYNSVIGAMFVVIIGLIGVLWSTSTSELDGLASRVTEIEHQIIAYQAAEAEREGKHGN
jgi:hypothetical protein